MKKFLFLTLVLFCLNKLCFADYEEKDVQVPENRIPWSGWYWPMHSAREPHLYDESVSGQDGPLKKFDLFQLDKNTVLSPENSARLWEVQDCTNSSCTTGHKLEKSGSGHCDAWAAASILGVDNEPKYGTSVGAIPSSDGSVNFLNFRVGDLKGLLPKEQV